MLRLLAPTPVSGGNPIPVQNVPRWNFIVHSQQAALRQSLFDMMRTAATDISEARKIAKKHVIAPAGGFVKALEHANYLLSHNPDFRSLAEHTLHQQMRQNNPSVRWMSVAEDGRSVPAFRFIAQNPVYGSPRDVFQHGMPVSLFNVRSEMDDVLMPAEIVTYKPIRKADGEIEWKLSVDQRYDMLGFVFGPNISTALRVGHSACQRFTPKPTRSVKNGYLYMLSLDTGYSVADAIFTGSGYVRNRAAGLRGEKGMGCQEDACEVAAGVFIQPTQILAVRMVSLNGELGPVEVNRSVDPAMIQSHEKYIDTKIFLESSCIDDIRQTEALLYPDRAQHEDFDLSLLNAQRRNRVFTAQIQREEYAACLARSRMNMLLQYQGGQMLTKYCAASLSFFSRVESYKAGLRSGELLDAKRDFDARKAASEDELKRRIAAAYRW